MRANLLEFLFGKATVQKTLEHDLGEQIVKLFEDADEVEGIEMVANKKPLAAALKALGIDEPVTAEMQSCELHCDDDQKYHEYCRILGTADAMTKLAEMGWVLAKCGDVAMSNEKPDYILGFIEIQTPEESDKDKPEDAEKLRKAAQKDAATEPEHDKDNPVEVADGEMGDKATGVGKPKDGADPEGKPKGSTKESIDDLLEAPPLLEKGGYYCSKCKKPCNASYDAEKKAHCCPSCKQPIKSKTGLKTEATTTSGVPAFPSGGNPMSILSPEDRRQRFQARRRKPPVKTNYAGSPTNS